MTLIPTMKRAELEEDVVTEWIGEYEAAFVDEGLTYLKPEIKAFINHVLEQVWNRHRKSTKRKLLKLDEGVRAAEDDWNGK